MHKNSKNTLRKQLLANRKLQDEAIYAQHSKIAQELLIAQEFWKNAQSIALYMPITFEVDTNILLESAWGDAKTVLLPRCNPNKAGYMDFFQCKSHAELQLGKFNILEPTSSIKQNNMDLLILPALAYDRKGYRLGFGGGYYDRFLSNNHNIFCLGLCFSWQVLDNLPTENWDKPVKIIINEEGILWT